jgi:DNA polymerase III delta prime subunit
MLKTSLSENIFENEFEWLGSVLKHRLSFLFNGENKWKAVDEFNAPGINGGRNPFYDFVLENKLTHEERLVLVLALVPHILPSYLDDVIMKNLGKTGDFPQLGGIRSQSFRGFLPTGETVLFLLAGNNLEKRFSIKRLFNEEHLFARKQILWLANPVDHEPRMSGKLIVSDELVEWFTQGVLPHPRFGINFPAQLIQTRMEWDDLVLNEQTMMQVQELETWVKHGGTLLNKWGMARKIKPGYRVLFHGPPGTGKTLTATLLGKYTGKDVYKIDLSMVISKYIGETEKNLGSLFDKAANKDWILFFDEADALFGKRTGVKDAHDKYANQEVSYLLQRTEDYPGLVILASNYKSNIDDAFARRFQSFIYFPLPKAAERIEIWNKAFPAEAKLQNNSILPAISKKYELTGSNIMNVVQYACLKALSRNNNTIYEEDLLKGIEKEFLKEGKMI